MKNVNEIGRTSSEDLWEEIWCHYTALRDEDGAESDQDDSNATADIPSGCRSPALSDAGSCGSRE